MNIEMDLLIARHPQTEANSRQLVLGAGDSPLTGEGIAVFRGLMAAIGSGVVKSIVSSPLPRALAGARIAADIIGGPILVEPALAELSAGRWEGRPRAELPLKGQRIRGGWTDRPPGGESYLDAEKRLAPFMDKLDALLKKGLVLVIGHAVVNRVLLKLRLGLEPEEALAYHQAFDRIFIISGSGVVKRLSLERSPFSAHDPAD